LKNITLLVVLRIAKYTSLRLSSRSNPQLEAEARSFVEGATGMEIGPDFAAGLKDGVILYGDFLSTRLDDVHLSK
jgi:hypothetical protein